MSGDFMTSVSCPERIVGWAAMGAIRVGPTARAASRKGMMQDAMSLLKIHEHAPIDEQCRAVHVASHVRREKHDAIGDIRRVAEPACWNASSEVSELFWVGEIIAIEICEDRAGQYRVAAYAIWSRSD